MRIIYILIALLFLFANTANAQSFTEPVSCWALEEESGTRADSIGTNHLTDNNTVTALVGKLGNAAVFDSANTESLTSGATSELTPSTFSITGWFRSSNPTTTSGEVLVSSGTYSLGNHNLKRYLIYVKNSSVTGAVGHDSGGSTLLTSPVTIDLNTWYFFALVFDNDNNLLVLYVNDTKSQTSQVSETMYTASTKLSIGRVSEYPDGYYKGRVDNVAFYNIPLLDSEIEQIYNNGEGVSCAALSGDFSSSASVYSVDLPSGGSGTLEMKMDAGEMITALGIALLVLLTSYNQLSAMAKGSKPK